MEQTILSPTRAAHSRREAIDACRADASTYGERMLHASRMRAPRLLSEGYRFERATPTLWRCHRPAGKPICDRAAGNFYSVDLERCLCTCVAFTARGTCSHLLAALNLYESGFDPRWFAGVCTECGGPMVGNSVYVGGRGYRSRLDCWRAMGEDARCGWQGEWK